MKKYICYEMNEVHTKQEWLQWFEENGDKEDYDSSEDWFFDNVNRYHTLKIIEE